MMKAGATRLFVAVLTYVFTESVVAERNTACIQRTVDYHCCRFPFRYKGVKYKKCTNNGDAEGRFWCATEDVRHRSNETTSWGYCKLRKSQCLVKTTDGECCKFPFKYLGKDYISCAATDNDPNGEYWCATENEFDRNLSGSGWGYCAGSTCFSCRSNTSWAHCNKNIIKKICPYKFEHCNAITKEETHSWGENSNKSEIVTKTFTKDCSSDSDCANPDLYCDGHLNCLLQCCHGNLCNAGKSLRGYLQGIIVLSFAAVFLINFPLLRESEIRNGHS